MLDVELGADEALGEVVERRPERVVEDHAPDDPVVRDQPGVVDRMRRRHLVGDEHDRRELVDRLADAIDALQLVEQVGDSEFVVRVLDLVERRGLGLLGDARVDLRAMLLLVLLRALDDAFTEVLLGVLGRGRLVVALAHRAGELHGVVTARRPLRGRAEVLAVLRAFDDFLLGARCLADFAALRP